ncbi:hypothetical protein AC629_41540 [Bradyrhizobium sp. NAS80.1]|uniref:hypothetical protein n=1 Tax=Bradyrhizobium sp. NAS80.1 TaxID=1680159 RepID=UPI0009599661|nr:hypothetical protein [Bradyrhizobium sp. NAS80.1]OKO69148.1 hypothetical protein AC629_41540 [Bradyrhizobium sp. NAS80.1]
MTFGASIDDLFGYYSLAKSWIERSRFASELHWQGSLSAMDFSEPDFLREYAWIVLNSGFREAVVRKHFDYISLCYCDWQSAREIVESGEACITTASAVFGNIKKLRAIAYTASILDRMGFCEFKNTLINDFGFSQTLPFVGPVTAHHLAKNLGFDVAKPDRHLVRLAMRFGYKTVHEMCSAISRRTGDSLGVTDLVLWRFEEPSRVDPTLRAGGAS